MNTSPFVAGLRPTGRGEAPSYTANRKVNWKVLDFVKCGGLALAKVFAGGGVPVDPGAGALEGGLA